MAAALVSRLLHEPTLRLKGSVGGDSAYLYIHALRELFALEGEPSAFTLGAEDDVHPAEESKPAAVTELGPRRERRR
jgi:hypothetical protein